ncbi:hypothetical protein F5Y16DRAFT_413287 [Xylariaceae sp. FL0255]|nr:hypothetical protein F5Y16DRAFT_413287 [Xylariaceae sp. FL0255]
MPAKPSTRNSQKKADYKDVGGCVSRPDHILPPTQKSPSITTQALPHGGHNRQITLDNKVVAITGANQGIGLGIAEVCLANSAACVFSLDISTPGDDLAKIQKQYPGYLEYIQPDVTSEESVKAALDKVVEAKGRFDGLIANAGATKKQPALDFTMEQFEKLYKLNVNGSWICATAAARKFIELKTKGSIIFTASMTSMTRTLVMEWAQYDNHINSISPGFVKTALTYYVETSPDWDTKMKYYGGMPRLALPQELGGAYVYLLSDTATYTMGIDIPIAGIVGAW